MLFEKEWVEDRGREGDSRECHLRAAIRTFPLQPTKPIAACRATRTVQVLKTM